MPGTTTSSVVQCTAHQCQNSKLPRHSFLATPERILRPVRVSSRISTHTHKVDCFDNRVHFIDTEGLHMSLTIANRGFGIDHMLAANLSPTHCYCCSSSSSQPPILSMTAVAKENSAFILIALMKSNSSLTRVAQNCFCTCSLVALATALRAICAQALPVFSSNKAYFSSHSSVLIGGPLYTWPPITGAATRCQNIGSGHFLKTPAAEDTCHQVSHALDNDPRGKTHPQQRNTTQILTTFGWLVLSFLGSNFHCKSLWY